MGTALSCAYRPRQPEGTALHQIVREHLETFLDEARQANGDGYPRFVEPGLPPGGSDLREG